jgi:hypothetical protein
MAVIVCDEVGHSEEAKKGDYDRVVVFLVGSLPGNEHCDREDNKNEKVNADAHFYFFINL